jgi:hypothetical protein
VTIESVHVDDQREIEGDWFELRVNRDNLDLGGWRITDNDTIDAHDEGSISFLPDPLLENLAAGTLIRVIATESSQNAARFPADGRQDGILVLYAGNGRLDAQTDPWFNLGPRDNLLLLAPGPSAEWTDDIPVDLWSANEAVERSSFGLPPGSR